MPLLSVIIPTHGRPDQVAHAVETVHRQGFADLECIVVDDASPDPIVARPGVHLVRLDVKAGASMARMAGVQASMGEYVAFLDDDDDLLPGWGEAMSSLIDEDVGIVCCGAIVEDVNSGERREKPPRPMGHAYAGQIGSFLPGSYAVRRDVFYDAGGFAEDVPYGEHHELALRIIPTCLQRGLRVASTAALLVLKRHDRGKAVRRSYHRSRVDAVEIKLHRHQELLAGDPEHFANSAGVGGYSAAALGEFARARKLYLVAIRAQPRRIKNYLRYGATVLPLVRRLLWD